MKNVSFAAVFWLIIFQFCSFSRAEDIQSPVNPIVSHPTQSVISGADSAVNSPQRDENIDFSRHLIGGNFRGAASIQALDMDNDGDIDVVGSSNRSGVAWWENDGEQSFERHDITDVEGVRSVAAADFGNDGDIDIVVPSYYDNNVSLLVNDGDFGFQRIVILSEYEAAEAVDVVDIDNDGDMDVLTAAHGDGRIIWLENDGNEDFEAHVIGEDYMQSPCVKKSDLDLDGDWDIIACGNRKITWWENDGDQEFSEHNIEDDLEWVNYIHTADIDDDDDMDVLATTLLGRVYWYENDGENNFEQHLLQDEFLGASSVHAADIDNDGDMDVLGTAISDDMLAWWDNNGEEDFEMYVIDDQFSFAYETIASDIDQDGDMDIIAASYTGNSIAWWENTLDPPLPDILIDPEILEFGEVDVYESSELIITISNVGDADLNVTEVWVGVEYFQPVPDFEDMIVIQPDAEYNLTVAFNPLEEGEFNSILHILSNDPDEGDLTISVSGTGVPILTFIEHTIDNNFDAARSITALDLDGDGDIGVVGAASRDDLIAWWENDGDQDFQRHAIDAYEGALSVYVIDVDNDGDYDVVGASSQQNDVSWWENNGIMGFTRHIITDDFEGSCWVHAVDLDEDGDIDIISAASTANRIIWWENDGEEEFTDHIIAENFEYACYAASTDLDSDGDIDIIGAARSADRITWWENDGDENFTPHDIDADFDGANCAYPIDIDGDGDVDVLGAATVANEIAWYENNGGALFSKHLVDDEFAYARTARTGDLDRDGDLDIVGAGLSNYITWWENRNDEGFLRHNISVEYDGSVSIIPIDLDLDYDIDIVCAAHHSDYVTWWENTLDPSISHIVVDPSTVDFGEVDVDNSTQSSFSIRNSGDLTLVVSDISVTGEYFDVVFEGEFSLDNDEARDIAVSFSPGQSGYYNGTVTIFSNDPVHPEFTVYLSGTGIGDEIILFTKHIVTDDFSAVWSITDVDFDGDGDIDLVSGATAESGIAWWENNGNQEFDRRYISGMGGGRSIEVADMDEDGDLDVIIPLFDVVGGIYLLENDGDFNFEVRQILDDFAFANDVYVIDLDDDGDLDILGATHIGKITWLEQDDEGGYIEHEIADDVSSLPSVIAADLNQDGDMDLLTVGGRRVSWWENDGGQEFEEHILREEMNTPTSGRAVDLDNDGDLDIVVLDHTGGGEILWLINDGEMNFESLEVGELPGINTVRIGDVDLDGNPDFFGTSHGHNTVAWWWNDGNQQFTIQNLDTAFTNTFGIIHSDLDLDGDFDLIALSSTDATIAWWENHLDPHISEIVLDPISLDFDTVGVLQSKELMLNISNRGDIDLVVHSIDLTGEYFDVEFEGEIVVRPDQSHDLSVIFNPDEEGAMAGELTLFTNDPHHQQVTVELSGFGIGGLLFIGHVIDNDFDGAFDLSVVDLDGDGDMDVVGVCVIGDDLAWWENDGDQNFTKYIVSDDYNDARIVFTVDMDSDGDIDILTGSAFNGRITWWENDSEQQFASHQITDTFDGVRSISAADLDGDGDIDVIGASGSDDEIAWWENNGEQNFTRHVIQYNYNYAHHITAVDLDLDGDLDLLGAARLDDCVSWWENDGDEEFTLHHIDENLDGAIFTYPVDLDDDGDIDVLAAAEVGDQVVWYENDGEQNFSGRIIDDSFNSVRSVSAADFDLDGDMDVLAAAQQDDEISWWENDGEEGFTKHTVSADLNGVNLALVADLDGDRDFDILAAVYYDDDVLWWENTLDPPLPMISVTPATLEFAPVDLYNTSQELILIANNGDADLTILDISVDNDRFDVEFDGQFTLHGDESREILISFIPDTSGITEGIFTVLSDDNVEGRIDVMLSGEGILPDTDVNWTRHDIINNYDGARCIHAKDIDGDGDYDIVGAAEMLNEISWWRNDGEFNFERYVLTNEFNRVTSVYAIDLDEDGDVDILGSARADNELAWWENDGEEDFTWRTITDEFEGAFKLSAVDLDQDDDLDVIAISYDGGEVGWWENDGNMHFTEHIVENEFPHGQDIMAVDIDSDGDLDLLGASHEDNEVAWWENNGNMGFARHTVDDEFTGAKSVYAADLDDDGDMDVLGTAIIGDELSWWENDGEENWTAHSLADNLDGAMGLHAADLDFDGDIDILATARNSGIVHWWESLNGNYFIERIVDQDFPNARRLQGVDMDFDGDTDVICVGGNRISWWENGLDPTIPDIDLEPEEIDFGECDVGLDHDLILMVGNIGDETLLIYDIVIEGEAFSSDFEDVLTIPSNETGGVKVTFSPDETTEYEGILTITSNDPDETVLHVQLFGVGVIIPRPPQVVNPIEDQQVQLNFEPYAVANLNDVFWDPNGDEMEFGVETDNINLIAAVSLNGTLLMSSSFNWAGNAVVTVYADDGYEEERDFRRGRVLRQTGMSATPHEVVVDRQTPNVRLPNERVPRLAYKSGFKDEVRNLNNIKPQAGTPTLHPHPSSLISHPLFPRRDFVTEHSFNVEVIGANDPPEWIELPDDFHVDEGEVVEFDVEGRDPEGDNLTIRAYDLPEDADFNDQGEGRGSFHWQTDEDDTGYYTIRLVLTDGLSSVDALINIMVGAANRPPEWTDIPDSVEIEENILYQLTVRGSDPDDDRLFISFDPLDMPIAACFTDSGDGSGVFEWATEDGDEGEYLGLFTITDRQVSVEAEVRFIVVNDNHPPVWEEFPDDIIAGIGDLIEFDVRASDPDDDYLSIGYSSGELPADEAYFTYNGDGTGTFSWQTENDDAGDYVLKLYLFDGEFLLEEILNIRVIEMDFPPEWEELPDDIVVDEGELIQFSVRGIDRNNDTLSIDFDPGEMPMEAVFNDAGDGSGDFSWQTDHADAGEYSAIFTLSDGETAVDTLIRITVQQDYILDVPDEYETIQAAIDMASNGDTVLVQPDTYIELIDYRGKDIVVGSLYLSTQNEGYIESTIIDADGNGGAVTFNNGESNDAVLTGFTIQNGIQPGVGNGGGILCDDASPTIIGCLIRNNQARSGGGIHVNNNAAPLISHCSFISNLATSYGGGISINEASPVISYCIINGNEGTIRGGGIYCQDESSDPAVSFSLIINNSSTSGGGVCANTSNITIDNCTISGNSAGNLGSGILCRYGGRAVITNSIIVNNEDDNIRAYPRDRNNLVSLAFCDIEGGLEGVNVPEEDLVWGEGNIDEDPLFDDPDADDYHLTEDSPCIDAGDPDAARDPDGTHADIGAYYFHHEPGAAILVEPLSLNFGEIHFTGRLTNSLTISSVGERTLDVIDISVDGQGFTVDFEQGFSLEPSEDSLITVTFEPDAAHLFLAELVIISNDPDDDEIVISLSGMAVNEDPVWIDLPDPDQFGIEIGDLIEFDVRASDPDGDNLTIEYDQGNLPDEAGFVDLGDGRGEFNWQTDDGDEGEFTLTLTLSDGAASIEALIHIAVNAPNQPPVWDEVPDDIFAPVGDRIEFTVSGSDPDDDHLVISYDPGDLPEEARFIDQGNGSGIFIWLTGEDDAGYYSVSLSLSDGDLTADTLINISVEAPNEPPVWDEVPDEVSELWGGEITFEVHASDPDGDQLELTAESDNLPEGWEFNDNGDGTGSFYWYTGDDLGDYMVTFTASDGDTITTAQTMIEVFESPPPRWLEIPEEVNAVEGDLIEFSVLGGWANPDVLSIMFRSDDLPDGYEFTDLGGGEGNFSWQTDHSHAGEYSATFELWFFDQGFVEAVVNIIVEQDYVLNVPDEYETIQAAIDVSSDGDTVLVDPGEYVENIDFSGKDIIVASLFLIDGEEDHIEETIIDGDRDGAVVRMIHGESEDALLNGFTLRNGRGALGGGISINGCKARITYCRIIQNNAQVGGGIFLGHSSDVIIDNCKILDNTADQGAGICLISNDNSELRHCTIAGNSEANSGGGIFSNRDDHVQFSYCVIAHNSSRGGGGVYCNFSNLVFSNCTITNNQSRLGGGGIRTDRESTINVYNTILWDNTPQQVYNYRDNFFYRFAYSDIEGGQDGIESQGDGEINWLDGNIDEDPLFADPDNGDFHLTEDSPCIDAGDPDSPEDPDETRADMGAYYFHQEPAPEIFVDPLALEFDEVQVNESEELTFTISNDGDEILTVSDISVEGDYFSTDFEGEFEVEPDAEAVITVTFAPEEEGEFNGVITISSNDPRNREVEVEVTGSGVGINDPPEIVSPIENIVLDEDFEPFVIADLDTVFSDPNDDELTYDAESDNENLTAEIIDESLLSLSVEPNWFGETVVTVTADDGWDEERDQGPVRKLRSASPTRCRPAVVGSNSEKVDINTVEGGASTAGNRIFTQNSKFKIQNSTIPRRDLSTELQFTVTVNSVNHDPVWVSLPDDTVEVDADQHVGFDLEASDIDNDELNLDWIRGNLPEEARFIDNDDNSGTFSWMTQREDEGEYIVGFTASDGEAQIEFELLIIVSPSRTPVYFTDFDTTDASHHLIIPLLELVQREARTGWEVGVFTPDDLLAGAGVWFEGEALALEAWADDPNTGDVEGFTEGESFTFKVWVSDEDAEYEAFGFFEEGPDSWEEDATSTVSVMGIVPGEIRVLFNQGWNMVSINIAPEPEMYREGEMRGPDIILMNEPLRIAPYEHSIIIMKDGLGRFYAPAQEFCNIEFWNLEEGYRFNLDRASEVTWTGGQIPFDADISLREGWNIVAYYPTFELDASAPDFYVLSNILDNLIMAKDGDGHFMVPRFNYSNLPPWRPTRGYQIQTDADVVLNYPEEQQEQALAIPQMQDYPTDTGQEWRWYLPPQSDRNMSVLVISISPDAAVNGDEIGAFDLSGELVGAGVVSNGSCGLAVWGDVPDSEAREGLIDGEAFELRLWTADTGIERSLEIGSIVEGDGTVYQKDNLLVLKVLVREEIVPETFLSDAFPNPFNAVTVLSYGISTHSMVVINIYDLRGVLVETLISSDHPAGSYRVAWNGSRLPSGVYIISMRSREFFTVRKVVLMK